MIEIYGLLRIEERGILLEVVKGGQVDNVRTLLDAGMNPSRSQDGVHPIWCAAQNGKLQIVKPLPERGAIYNGSMISAIIYRGTPTQLFSSPLSEVNSDHYIEFLAGSLNNPRKKEKRKWERNRGLFIHCRQKPSTFSRSQSELKC